MRRQLVKSWERFQAKQSHHNPFLVLSDTLIYILTILILFVSTPLVKVKEGFLGSAMYHVLDSLK